VLGFVVPLVAPSKFCFTLRLWSCYESIPSHYGILFAHLMVSNYLC
jgi:hypothetical protein